MRIVSWFSCGVTSTVSTILTLEKYKDIVIVYCETGSEHPDNERYIKDCEKLFEQKIIKIKNPKFKNIYDVWDYTGYIENPYGAKCTLELKKKPRLEFQDKENDLQIFGYINDEPKRIKKFLNNNKDINIELPLVDNNISKDDCFKKIKDLDIVLPMMYRLGYRNNNCIGCVKGAKGYWNKIRKDFPDIFEKTAQYEEAYGTKLLNVTENYKVRRITLRELDKDRGWYHGIDIEDLYK